MVKLINLLFYDKLFPKVIIRTYKNKTRKKTYLMLLQVPMQFEFLSSHMDPTFYLI